LDIISGSSSTSILVSGTDDVSFTGAIGAYVVNVTSGTEAADLAVSLTESASTTLGKVTGAATSGLEIIYSSGSYTTITPGFTDTLSSGAGDTQAGKAMFYTSSTLYTGGIAGLSGLTLIGNLSVASGGGFANGSGPLSGTYDLTEALVFGNPAVGGIHPGAPQFAALQAAFASSSSVPDGGMTLGMVGSVFMGLTGLRSKFGAKRA
jgi:hypothetical protein